MKPKVFTSAAGLAFALLGAAPSNAAITVFAEYHLGEPLSLGTNNLPLDSIGGHDFTDSINPGPVTIGSPGAYAGSAAFMDTSSAANSGYYNVGNFTSLPNNNVAIGVFARASAIAGSTGTGKLQATPVRVREEATDIELLAGGVLPGRQRSARFPGCTSPMMIPVSAESAWRMTEARGQSSPNFSAASASACSHAPGGESGGSSSLAAPKSKRKGRFTTVISIASQSSSSRINCGRWTPWMEAVPVSQSRR